MIHFVVQQKLTQHCEATILPINLKKEKKRKSDWFAKTLPAFFLSLTISPLC